MNQAVDRPIETGVGCVGHAVLLVIDVVVGALGVYFWQVRQQPRWAVAMLAVIAVLVVIQLAFAVFGRRVLVPELRAVVIYNWLDERFVRLAVSPGYETLRFWETPRGLLNLGPESVSMEVMEYTHNDTPVTVHWSGLVQFDPRRWQPEGAGIAFLQVFLRQGIAGSAQALLYDMTRLALKECDALTLTHRDGQLALRKRTADKLGRMVPGSGLVYGNLEVRRVVIPPDLDELLRGGYGHPARVAEMERQNELNRLQKTAQAQTEAEVLRVQLAVEYERKRQEWQLLEAASAQAFRRRVLLETAQALGRQQLPGREQLLLQLIAAQMEQLEGKARAPRAAAETEEGFAPPPPPRMNGRHNSASAGPAPRRSHAGLNGLAHPHREREPI